MESTTKPEGTASIHVSESQLNTNLYENTGHTNLYEISGHSNLYENIGQSRCDNQDLSDDDNYGTISDGPSE
ncbi:hypothetical protein DPMN_102118 [Dreissena polymorpha]|uniref:Uncharacterized protein n=1 Tax=Dreissena polymorpha TaxID=45954 RepID=A0A9D4LKP1_DREPO|nr:hypothetical protein DPMN_102118 [Dreissena polymorpha]